MLFPHSISWPSSPAEAIALQKQLRGQVAIAHNPSDFKITAGVDVSHDRQDTSHAAIVLLDASGHVIESARAAMPTGFPYIPGLLSFREIPVILAALRQLNHKPDLLMVDGHGIAHPRRLGIAAHLGVVLDMPTIGVAKKRLTGKYTPPAPEKGSYTKLMDGKEHIGTVLRSKDRCLPLFVSPGHKLDQDQALSIVLRWLTKYRLPEPTRLADKLSKSRESPEQSELRLAV